MLDVYQLGFGTVCGICTGVFLKKGLRAIAFLLGGVFVLLQVRHNIYKKGRERADG
jgi:FUN14 domain-containing protein 1